MQVHKESQASVTNPSAHGLQGGQVTNSPRAVILLPTHTSVGKPSFSYFILLSLKNARCFYRDKLQIPFLYRGDMSYKFWRAYLTYQRIHINSVCVCAEIYGNKRKFNKKFLTYNCLFQHEDLNFFIDSLGTFAGDAN